MESFLKQMYILPLIACLLPTNTAFAGELPVDWRGVRSSGMGGAFTAIGNDETAPFTNPSGIARLRNPRSRSAISEISFPNLQIGGNSEAVRAIQDARSSPKSTISSLLKSASASPGTPLYTEVQMFPYGVLGSKGGLTYLVGVPVRVEQHMRVEKAETPSVVHLVSNTTASFLLGVAGQTRGGVMAYGLSLRPNYRYLYDDQVNSQNMGSFGDLRKRLTERAQRTTASSADAGLLFTAPDFWLPSLGVAVRNIPTGCVKNYENPVTGKSYTMCGSMRSGSSAEAQPQEKVDPTEVRAGVSLTPRVRVGSQKWNLRVAGDVWPIPVVSGTSHYGFSDLTFTEMLHFGAELSTGNALRERTFLIRAGMSNGNVSYGGGFLLGILAIDYASYTSTSGFDSTINSDNGTSEKTTARQSSHDRRHLLGITARW